MDAMGYVACNVSQGEHPQETHRLQAARDQRSAPENQYGGCQKCGSKLNRRGYAGFSLWFHLPGFHFGTMFLSRSQVWLIHPFGVSDSAPCLVLPKQQAIPKRTLNLDAPIVLVTFGSCSESSRDTSRKAKAKADHVWKSPILGENQAIIGLLVRISLMLVLPINLEPARGVLEDHFPCKGTRSLSGSR